jgi:hypothetical protein
VGWYQIVNYTNVNTLVLDRTPATAGAGSSGTFYIGGAMNVGGSLEDDFFEQCTFNNTIYIKNGGSYTSSEGISISTAGNASLPIKIVGYQNTRGDNPTGTNRPVFAMGTNGFSSGNYWNWDNFIVNTTSTNGAICRIGAKVNNIKVQQSYSASRPALRADGAYAIVYNSEFISTNGTGISPTSNVLLIGNRFHDSGIGIEVNGVGVNIINNLIDDCIIGITNPGTENHGLNIIGNT